MTDTPTTPAADDTTPVVAADAEPFTPPPPPAPPLPPAPPEADVFAASEPAPSKRKNGVIAAVALTLIAALVVVIVVAAHKSEKLSLTGSFEFSGTSNDDCQGSDGYDDIGPNTQVTVSSGGNVLGFTDLGTPVGPKGAGVCDWVFTINNLPKGKTAYTVEVGRRGGINFSEAQVKAGAVAVTLGGN
jgi:hypothetical protein